MCAVGNDIYFCIVHKAIPIVFIPNEYYQFRTWYKFVGMNFTREEHIGSIAKDTEVQFFGFVIQEDLLRCFLLKMFNRYVIVCMYELQLLLQIPTKNLVGMLQVTLTVPFQARYGSIVQHDYFVSIHVEY